MHDFGSDAISSGLIHWLHVHVEATGGIVCTSKQVKCTSVAYFYLIRVRSVGHDSKKALHSVVLSTWKLSRIDAGVIAIYSQCCGCLLVVFRLSLP